MTDDLHKKQWEDLRDFYLKKYEDTKEDRWDVCYHACKRLLGEEQHSDDTEFKHFQ